MGFFQDIYSTAVAAYTAARPGRGLGLQLGILGTIVSFFSVTLYVPRNNLSIFMTFGAKRHWLDAHMILGLLGPLFVALHASYVWSKLAGVANLAMWGTVLSGVLTRYFFARIPLSRLKREWLLRAMERSTREAMQNLQLFLKPRLAKEVYAAFNSAGAYETEPRLVQMIVQFFKDLRAIMIITTQVRRLPTERASAKPVLTMMKQLIVMRNILFLKLLENSAEFWRRVHIFFTVAFGALVGVHVLVIWLFKPQFLFS